jgi:hypothetical protein
VPAMSRRKVFIDHLPGTQETYWPLCAAI